jgi:hypothetical protein
MIINLREGGDWARLILHERSVHDVTWATVKKMPFPLRRREFVNRQLCFTDKQTGDLVVVFDPLPETDKVDYGGDESAMVRAATKGVLRLSPMDDGSRCRVTLLQYAESGGFIPERVTAMKAVPAALSTLVNMANVFQRNEEIDAANMGAFAATVDGAPQVYEEEEKQMLVRGKAMFEGLKEEDFTDLDSPDYHVKMYSMSKEGDSSMTIRGSVVRTGTLPPNPCLPNPRRSRRSSTPRSPSPGCRSRPRRSRRFC